MEHYYICPDCGHTVLDRRPTTCPVCATDKTALTDHDHLTHLQEMMVSLTAALLVSNKSTHRLK